MLERSQVFKLRAVEKDLSLTALASIDQDQFKYSKVSNNLRNKALFCLFTLQVWLSLGAGMSSGKVYTRSSSFGTSAVPRASILELKYSADIFKHGWPWITRMNVAMLYIKEIRPLHMQRTDPAIKTNPIGWQAI